MNVTYRQKKNSIRGNITQRDKLPRKNTGSERSKFNFIKTSFPFIPRMITHKYQRERFLKKTSISQKESLS